MEDPSRNRLRTMLGELLDHLQRLAMILTHATSLFGLLHPIASTVSHGRSPE